MKKYHIITIIAAIALIGLQAGYINRLYEEYIYRVSVDLEELFRTSISRELSLRNHRINTFPDYTPWQEKLYMRWLEDMSPQERDSLIKITQPGDTINVDEARKAGIGRTNEEIERQLTQDRALFKKFPIDLHALDSLFMDLSEKPYAHTILLYGKHKTVTDSSGALKSRNPEYASALLPIGTKGLQYVQLKADIPRSQFIKQQFVSLALSAGMIGIVLACLLYQMTGIRKRDQLLLKREVNVNGIIHDLKSPLNSMITLLGWMEPIEQDARLKTLIAESRAGLKRLSSQVESLLTTARKEKQRIVLVKSEIDLPQIVGCVDRELSTVYHTKQHTLEVINRLPASTVVHADPIYIENVIRNLLENALKYSDDGVAITITLEQQEHTVEVSVKDTGWGIPRKYQRKLFTPFYQVPRGDRDQKGYGIGLAQSRNIIQAHGGTIQIKSTENQGSIITLRLPLIT